jgi:hypothetical protein
MTMIYLLIMLSPLASFAMQLKPAANTVTGECSGDCRIDGCSVERSAAHTCCCWQKRQLTIGSHLDSGADSSDTRLVAPVESPKMGSCCCTVKARDSHKKNAEPGSVSSTAPQKKMTTTVSSSPCGSGKLFTMWNTEILQHLPYFFAGEIPVPEQSFLTFFPPGLLSSRYGDPPDPPPIIS